MSKLIGVIAVERIAAGLVENSQACGPLQIYPHKDADDALAEMPAEEIVERIASLIRDAGGGHDVAAIGVGFPGIIKDGVIEDSPNLQQMKGQNLAAALHTKLKETGLAAPVSVFNDADVMAAGIAATRGQLDRLIRVWSLGGGVGYGRYPQAAGVWEGGHMVVSLDPKEQFCRCGGRGHIEGIMGERAMRLRFLDLEPDEVFAHAREGDKRCAEFVQLWHRALAAASATSVHLDGPGKFYVTGPNAVFVQLGLLDLYLNEMVKMSPLQGSLFEIAPANDEVAVIGAAVSAGQAAMDSEPCR